MPSHGSREFKVRVDRSGELSQHPGACLQLAAKLIEDQHVEWMRAAPYAGLSPREVDLVAKDFPGSAAGETAALTSRVKRFDTAWGARHTDRVYDIAAVTTAAIASIGMVELSRGTEDPLLDVRKELPRSSSSSFMFAMSVDMIYERPETQLYHLGYPIEWLWPIEEDVARLVNKSPTKHAQFTTAAKVMTFIKPWDERMVPALDGFFTTLTNGQDITPERARALELVGQAKTALTNGLRQVAPLAKAEAATAVLRSARFTSIDATHDAELITALGERIYRTVPAHWRPDPENATFWHRSLDVVPDVVRGVNAQSSNPEISL